MGVHVELSYHRGDDVRVDDRAARDVLLRRVLAGDLLNKVSMKTRNLMKNLGFKNFASLCACYWINFLIFRNESCRQTCWKILSLWDLEATMMVTCLEGAMVSSMRGVTTVIS